MIANCLDSAHRTTMQTEHGYALTGVFNPLTFGYEDLGGHVYLLDITAEAMLSLSGIKLAKRYFLEAVALAVAAGSRVILLGASTKRLFGDGRELRARFPEVLFTIGDNGTALAFMAQVDYVCDNLALDARILVLGAGFLGEWALSHLSARGYNNLVVISRHRSRNLEGPKIFDSLADYRASEDFEPVDLMLACAHNHGIGEGDLRGLASGALLALDVAVPKALGPDLAELMGEDLIRIDSGNYALAKLRLDFPYQHLGYAFEGEWYGCFTEALLLALSGCGPQTANFFKVNAENLALMQELLQAQGEDFLVPMRNFGARVGSYPSAIPSLLMV